MVQLLHKVEKQNTLCLQKNLQDVHLMSSGNYTVRPFQFNVEESVTVNENTGRFALGATTDDGNTASSDLLAIKVSPE